MSNAVVAQELEESQAAFGAYDAFGGDGVGECGGMEEESEAGGGGREVLDKVELVEAELAVGGVEREELDVSEHGGEVGGSESLEVGGSSGISLCVAEGEGVGNGDAGFHEAEEPRGGLRCVGVEHSAEEMEVVCRPGIGVCDERVECVIAVCIGACDEESEGVLAVFGQCEAEGE